MKRVNSGSPGLKKPPRLAARKHGLLDGAKPSEVVWEALAPIGIDAERRGGCESWVYFAAEQDGAVKIGVAKNPVQRRRELQCGNPRRIRVERVIYGDQITERLMHKAFSADLVEGTVEWFKAEVRTEILDAATEIANRQMAARATADMARMAQIAVETVNELEREIRIGDQVRLLSSSGIMEHRMKLVS